MLVVSIHNGKSKSNTNSIIGVEKTVPAASIKIQNTKRAKRNTIKTQSIESEILPYNEYEETNEGFKKFKNKRQKSLMSNSKDSRGEKP